MNKIEYFLSQDSRNKWRVILSIEISQQTVFEMSSRQVISIGADEWPPVFRNFSNQLSFF